jgi:hypothetical protein
MPLLDCKLISLTHKGKLGEDQVLTRALTVYGPDLSMLNMVRVPGWPTKEYPSWHARWIVQMVLQVETLKHPANQKLS